MQGDVVTVLATLPADSVHCVVTSPPYWGLRDYGVEGQIGLEPTPEAYVAKMVAVFREVRRVLRPDGVLFLNVGDSYWGGKGENGSSKARATADERGYVQSGGTVQMSKRPSDGRHDTLKPKDLVGIPWRLALALQADGWWLRSDIIWHKPNPMPESVQDRPTKSHEYVFLLTKAARYYYDAEAVKENVSDTTIERWGEKHERTVSASLDNEAHRSPTGRERTFGVDASAGRNLRDVWTIPSQPYPEAHFATFPEALVERPILAGTSEKGCCAECGAPWERVTETEQVLLQKTNNNGKQAEVTNWNRADNPRTRKESTTTGWRATCTHEAAVVPCTVLDPFLGSGTTLAVARRPWRAGWGVQA